MSSAMEHDFFVSLPWLNFLWCIGLCLKKHAVLVSQACVSRFFDGAPEFLMRVLNVCGELFSWTLDGFDLSDTSISYNCLVFSMPLGSSCRVCRVIFCKIMPFTFQTSLLW